MRGFQQNLFHIFRSCIVFDINFQSFVSVSSSNEPTLPRLENDRVLCAAGQQHCARRW
jgi:hypothetical protein